MKTEGLSNAEYHIHQAISKSDLDLFAKAPALYKHHKIDGNERHQTPEMEFGSAYHSLVLEGRDDDLRQMTQVYIDRGLAMRDVLLRDKRIENIIEHGIIERSFFARDYQTGLEIKCRPDIIYRDMIFDLKTTSDASLRGFRLSFYKLRYFVQAPFYLHVLSAAGVRVLQRFVFICQEKKEPYLYGLYFPGPEKMADGADEFMNNLEGIKRCMGTNEWPHCNSGKIIEI